MSSLDDVLDQRLQSIRAAGLYRYVRRVDSAQSPHLRLDDRDLLSFSSNDYLGLAEHPDLKRAAIEAVERYGAGCGASRLICGSLAPHHELEEAISSFKGTEATLVFGSGYAAALGTIPALLGTEDTVVLDKLVHASIVDAARLSGAKLRVFAHNDLNDLEEILLWASRSRKGKVLVVTESAFSMDGDLAPLKDLVQLKERHGAWLMVDEAHATGLYGLRRRGLAEELNVAAHIEIQMGTLGKAVGASGGYICGSRRLADYLLNRARSFIFSTAPVPAAAAAATAGISLIQGETGRARTAHVWELVRQLASQFAPAQSGNSCKTAPGSAPSDSPAWRLTATSPILPLIIGSESDALRAAAALQELGIFVPAIRYPTVARGAARLRITLSASHTAQEVARLGNALQELAL